MLDTRSSFYLFCTILLFFPGDPIVLSDPENETKEHVPELGATAPNKEGSAEEYPFDEVYYKYKIKSIELIKNAQLHPPIGYKTPEGYRILLEPIDHFCKGVNTSIFSKFTAINEDGKVYITVNEDLEDVMTNDATIVYKLKVINSVNTSMIGGETTVLIKVHQFLPIPDTILEFEEPSYSIKLSYGRKGKIFKFNVLKMALKTKDKDERQPENDKYISKNEYTFNGNISLEYVSELLLPKLRVNYNGYLEVIGNIDEGFYNFDVVAVDFAPNSSTTLKAVAKVHLFVENLVVCSSNVSNFIKAFSKHYITEETKLITAVPATGSNSNCTFVISHQYPLGIGDEFFTIDPKSGSVNVINPIDREAYPFEDMDEPSAYLRLKINCPATAEDAAVDRPAIKPLSLHGLLENIVYDPTTTLIQLVIVDANDNVPVFADKHIVVGYPLLEVADTIVPKHLVQVKATDKDVGKHGKIQYSLRGEGANDFVVINPETGTIYCTRLMNDSSINKTFEVVAKDNDGKPDGLESVLTVTVKFLTHSDIIRVYVKFTTTEDNVAIETQLSDISGVKVLSLTDDVINTFADDRWRMERMLTVYGVNSDGSLVSGLDLEKKLSDNAKILNILRYSTETSSETGGMSTMSIVCAVMLCLLLSMIAIGLLYFGYVKNGRYLSCILSTSTTPLKDDMENMSHSNWITTFNRSNLSSTRVRFPGNINSPASRSKVVDHVNIAVEKNLYEALPPKGNISADNNSSLTKLDSKLSFEDDLIKLEKMDEVFSPTDDRSFNF